MSVLNPGDTDALRYIIMHVFCPLQLPDSSDYSIDNDHSLAEAIAAAASLYSDRIHQANSSQWPNISRMLENLQAMTRSESMDISKAISQFNSMDVGDISALLIRAQNAGVVFRKQRDVTIFEAFELSPKARDVMTAEGRLICSYPGPAIEIPNRMFDDEDFLSELVNFLAHMNRDELDVADKMTRGEEGEEEEEEEEEKEAAIKDTAHPRYITELLSGILRGIGHPANITRISKCVCDDVVCNDSKPPWRRSSLWLLIRVVLQTTLDRSPFGHHTYKEFMLFFMCRLAEDRACADLPCDLLQSMLAKISRRLRKLGPHTADWLSRIVLQSCTSLRSTIENRWKQVQVAQRASPPWTPSLLDPNRDIHLSLLCSGNHLRNSLVSHGANLPSAPFKPEHCPRGSLDDFLSSDGNFFEEVYRIGHQVALFDVERAVERGIDVWVARVTNNDEACVKLETLADKYSTRAAEAYSNNPELLSVMLLTTIELWVALDKVAIKEIPMLADYSPGVPISLLQDLLLWKSASLHRLRRAHEYLSRRHSQSRSQWSVFSSTITSASFAVRFYRKSSHLRHLKSQIEGVARHEVREKVAKLREMNARYPELRRMAERAGRTFNMHMRINVHEWPLPTNRLEAEVVVFELDCPISFNMWRTATFHLLDILSPSIRSHVPRIQLNGYLPLAPYFVMHPRSRISLGSNSKLFIHSSPITSIPAKRRDVCVKNELIFYSFDMRTGVRVSEALGRSGSAACCTYKLQIGPYRDLQKYVDSTSHTSNQVMVNQADCHKDLFIHEYIAFGHLRSGGLLQWLNILREIRSRSLSFRREEVHMLLAQAVSQVGPLANTEWTWHQELQQPTFCYALLGELQSLVQDVEASWLEMVTMDTISLLLRRLLVSSPEEAVSLEALGLLRTVRGNVFSWIQDLSASIKAPGDERSRRDLRDTAAICRSTFDTDPAMIPRLLHSAEDIEVLLSSAILVHDHTPSHIDFSRLPSYSQLLLDRDRRLSLALENVVSDIIQADSSDQGINLAVGRVWPDYHPGTKWAPLQAPNSRWFSCTTAPPASQQPQVLHFNILDGSLLVNGKTLGNWLPFQFARHPLYKLIFGTQILKVIPSDLPGMDYSTRGTISGHQLYFALRNNGSDLVIRAKPNLPETDDSEIFEIIPHEILEGDLPAVLIKGHTHWLNLSTSIMEIRPLGNLWEPSSENWKVDYTTGHYRMQKGNEFLIDIRSQTWDVVSSLLRPLSTPQDLIVSVSPADSSRPTSSLQLSVALPRYDLSFYVDEDGDLQSRNFQGMVYDENQSIGTLFGLVSQIVLRPKVRKVRSVDALELVPRCVLIPDGNVSFRMEGHHVRVEITPDSSVLKRITYQTYRANTDLSCLTGDGSLTSKLYCAYLHALTNGCGIDLLTERSGTEEALSILRSASCWSTVRISSRDAELLCLIASIWPSRTWVANQSMQKVTWRDLPANSQSPELYAVSKAIKERYELFYDGQSSSIFKKFPLQHDHLFNRAVRQAAYLFPPGFSRQSSEMNFDARYPGRHLVGVTSGECHAYAAATCVHRRTATGTKDIQKMVESWTVVGDTVLSLQYHRSWLAPDLSLIWLGTYNLLRQGDERKWFQLLFSLPAMAYASSKLRELVFVFVAFASHSQFRLEDPPHYDSYHISDGYNPSSATLRSHIVDCAYPRNLNFIDLQRINVNATTRRLLDAWPCEKSPPCALDPDLYDVANVESKVKRYFSSCFRNLKLKEHLTRVEMILNNLSEGSAILDTNPYSFQPSETIPSYTILQPITVDSLFSRPAPLLRAQHTRLPRYIGNTTFADSAPLHQLITGIEANAVSLFQHQYVSALRTSAESFGSEISIVPHATTTLPTAGALLKHHTLCRAGYVKALNHLQQHLGPISYSDEAVEQCGQWPRITAHMLFQCLASNSPIALPDDWKRCLTEFALLALQLQRARRLLLLHFDNLHEELRKELQNEGCDGWDAEAYPDWLLIQLQGNFLIRRVQAEVANEMIAPRSGDNTVMQLNMGEGKSSVIVPIVAAVLANGSQLVRVVVPKPLTSQTLYLLMDRLSGLTNRRIHHLPFSRALNAGIQRVDSLHRIMLECMEERGILVLQPEHVLSLKLVSVEKELSWTKESELPPLLFELQKWLHRYSRDILDESDEILDVRSQLVFTMGDQQQVEGSPERWTTTEQVLGLVSQHAPSLRELFPLGVECEPGPPGSFPYLRILQRDAGEKLTSWIVEDVVEGRLSNINFGQLHLHPGLRDAIRSFISSKDVSPEMVRLTKECTGKTLLWGGLLLLRGLLANGILLVAFGERRWRVDYGLAPKRHTMLAVPYRAKDVPAQRAEFGHPDIAIILTCLSHYYGGLSKEQLRRCFDILLKQHEPSLDYDLWVRSCPIVPESLRVITGVNTSSSEQWNEFLYPLFSRNRATINFYLSNVVFPREAKEFPSKLSSSGWDLAEKKDRLVTGFSGTNDGQYLLPLHITQRDPDHQQGTNAKVLSYLLQLENKHYMCMTNKNGKQRSIREFLQVLVTQQPEIRVLLDVGAQMLDLQNYELAKAWLDIIPRASGAIYFDKEDELMVCTRDGGAQLLRSSPLAQHIDRCVVYIDDAHTRGTDIKFPHGFRAAVTLGPKATKDRLVQGCMRMRMLGQGHSVMFFAPLDVDRHIRYVAGKHTDPSDVINTMDILHWAIQETWNNIQRWAPHWVQPGLDHTSRYAAWTRFCTNRLTQNELSDKWLQPEAKSLEDLYEPRNPSNLAVLTSSPDIHQRYIDLGVLSFSSVGMDEEQERELAYEVRREREVERPSSVPPADHSIHQDVINFVKTGVIPTRTKLFRARIKAFCPVFETLHATSAATDEAYVWSQSVLATTDFEQTVAASEKTDEYLRPVHWILSANRETNDVLVVLSPYEVNHLLPDIRSSKKVHLHLYTPRITKSMKACDDLALYSIPPVPDGWTPPYTFMDEANVFAGQLYLRNYETYVRLCRFLGLYTRELQGKEGFIVEPDGFILPKIRAKLSGTEIAHTFASTPIVALKALMHLRSKDVDFTSTHMGRLVHGRLLFESDFDG